MKSIIHRLLKDHFLISVYNVSTKHYLTDFGLSNLEINEFLNRLEEELGISIPNSNLNHITVLDLVNTIRNHK